MSLLFVLREKLGWEEEEEWWDEKWGEEWEKEWEVEEWWEWEWERERESPIELVTTSLISFNSDWSLSNCAL